MLLLVTAGLFILAFRAAQSIGTGFDGSQVITASVDLQARGYSPERGRAFVRTLTERLEAAPGVAAANAVDILPLTLSNSASHFLRHGDPVPAPNERPPIPWRSRSRELAIRLAIGATPCDIATLVVRHTLTWTGTRTLIASASRSS